MRRIIYKLLTLLIVPITTFGQTQRTEIKRTNVIIEGEIQNSVAPQHGNKGRSLKIRISKYPFDLFTQSSIDNKVYNIIVNYNKPFKVIVDSPSDVFYMHLQLSTLEGETYWSGWNNEYMLQKGDRIYCKLSNLFFDFSGKGSEKLKCQSELYRLSYKPTNDDLKLIWDKKYEEYIAVQNIKMDSCFRLQKAIVEKYKSKLGKDLTEIMFANCYGLRYWTWLRSYRIESANDTNLFHAFMISPAYKSIDLSLYHKFGSRIIADSYLYTNVLFEKLLLESIDDIRNRRTAVVVEELMREVFSTIKKKEGIIRDKLICLFIINYIQEPTLTNYMDEAISLVKSVRYNEILLNLKIKYLKGQPFYDFKLENANDAMVKLSDFKNKVVILDFWYTGCENCIILHEAMKPVTEKYKDYPSVKFVSISIDKDKKRWLESVKGGKYTDFWAINLYTAGLGAEHPLVKNYNINGFPTVFVLKSGKMYSATPPRPKLDPITFKPKQDGETKMFVDLIDEAIGGN